MFYTSEVERTDIIMDAGLMSGLKKNRFFSKLYKRPVVFSFLINICFLILILFCCDLKYEVSDDFVMASILSGAYGDTQNPYIIFVNVLIGYLLLPFYKIVPQISWYFVFQIAVITVSSTTIVFFLLDRLNKHIALMLSVIFLLFFVSDALILVQFTKTATFAVISGSVLFLDALYNKKNKIRIISGGVLCLCGTLIRFSTIYIVGGFVVLILLYETARFIKKKSGKLWIKQLIGILACGGMLIGASYGLKEFDRYVYNDNESYSFFNEFSSARAGIVDASDYGYGAYGDRLQQLGISENDYYMMRKWCLLDDEFFTTQKLREAGTIIKEYKESLPVSLENIYESLQNRKISSYPVFLACALLIILGIVLNYKNWKMMLASAGVGLGLLIYFVYRERCLYRIEFSVLLCVFICCIYFWEERLPDEQEESNQSARDQIRKICERVSIIVCAWSLMLFIPDLSYKNVIPETRKAYIDDIFIASENYDARKYRKVVNKDKPVNALLEEIDSHPENFYFLDFNTTIQSLYFEWSPWEALPVGTYDNFLYLGGITSYYPDTVKILESHGLDNPLKSLVNDNVYVVDSHNIEIKLTYLREHYYPNARAELYKDANGYQIWKIYKE